MPADRPASGRPRSPGAGGRGGGAASARRAPAGRRGRPARSAAACPAGAPTIRQERPAAASSAVNAASACRPEQSQKWTAATSTTTCRVPRPAAWLERVGDQRQRGEVGVPGQPDDDLVGSRDEGDVEQRHGASRRWRRPATRYSGDRVPRLNRPRDILTTERNRLTPLSSSAVGRDRPAAPRRAPRRRHDDRRGRRGLPPDPGRRARSWSASRSSRARSRSRTRTASPTSCAPRPPRWACSATRCPRSTAASA